MTQSKSEPVDQPAQIKQTQRSDTDGITPKGVPSSRSPKTSDHLIPGNVPNGPQPTRFLAPPTNSEQDAKSVPSITLTKSKKGKVFEFKHMKSWGTFKDIPKDVDANILKMLKASNLNKTQINDIELYIHEWFDEVDILQDYWVEDNHVQKKATADAEKKSNNWYEEWAKPKESSESASAMVKLKDQVRELTSAQLTDQEKIEELERQLGKKDKTIDELKHCIFAPSSASSYRRCLRE